MDKQQAKASFFAALRRLTDSINRIDDIVSGRGLFAKLGESWFDDYWMNYGKITVKESSGETSTIRNLSDFVKYRGGDPSQVVPKAPRGRKRS